MMLISRRFSVNKPDPTHKQCWRKAELMLRRLVFHHSFTPGWWCIWLPWGVRWMRSTTRCCCN